MLRHCDLVERPSNRSGIVVVTAALLNACFDSGFLRDAGLRFSSADTQSITNECHFRHVDSLSWLRSRRYGSEKVKVVDLYSASKCEQFE